MEDAKLKELLSDTAARALLKNAAHLRDEIRWHNMETNRLECEVHALENDIQKRFDISFPDYISLVIVEEELARKNLREHRR